MLAVGAVDSTGAVRAFSSRGPTFDGRHKPDVCARGWLTIAALPGGGYGLASGTSSAAPLVAGAAALLLEGQPQWSAHDVVEALRATATQAESPDDARGYGIVQALDALYHEPPVVPFPFTLLEPAEGLADAGPSVTFRWTRAFDVQTPTSIAYGIQFSTSVSFVDTVGWWWAGSDTTRTLDFLPVGSFHWRVVASDPDGHVRTSEGRSIQTTSATGHESPGTPAWVRFLRPSPNPFNPSVRLGFVLSRPAAVGLEVFDLVGRRVLRQPPRDYPAGEHALTWSGTDLHGRDVSSGVYLARLAADDGSAPPSSALLRLSLVR